MPWNYQNSSGRTFDPDFVLVAIGYSGRYPDGKNKPEMMKVKDVGPIPTGIYKIGEPVDTVTHGPYVLPLTPDPGNEMFGRSGFLIHGDSVLHPGTASEGCIVLPRNIREMMWNSPDHVVKVTVGNYIAPDVTGEISV